MAVWQERPPWPWVYLGTIPQRTGGPTGEQGNPFQEIFFHLVVYSVPRKPLQIQLLEVTWGLSVEFEEKLSVAAAIALYLLEENHGRFFRKQVFVHLNASCPTFMY